MPSGQVIQEFHQFVVDVLQNNPEAVIGKKMKSNSKTADLNEMF